MDKNPYTPEPRPIKSSEPGPTLTLSHARTNLERSLSPVYAECFTDETKKFRDWLLAMSFTLLLLVCGVVAVADEPIHVEPWPVALKVIGDTRWVLLVLCVYLLTMFCTRSYIEWQFWRLRHQAPLLKLHEKIEKQVLLPQGQIIKDLIDTRNKTMEMYINRLQADLKLPVVSAQDEKPEVLKKILDTLSREYDIEYKKPHKPGELSDLWNTIDDVNEELTELETRIREEKTATAEQKAAENEARDAEINSMERNFDEMSNDPALKLYQAECRKVTRELKRAKRVISIRLYTEMIFPIAFGIGAILLSIYL